MKKLKMGIIILILLIVVIVSVRIFIDNKVELKSITSKKQLERLYRGDTTSDFEEGITDIFCMPFSFIKKMSYDFVSPYRDYDYLMPTNSMGLITEDIATSSASVKTATAESSASKDYSTTNIQVENVDEADIVKTDGDYIYSLSESSVVITDASNPEEIKIAAKFEPVGGVPEDLILYNDKLVVISSDATNASYYYRNNNTIVSIYDITDKTKPVQVKSYTLYEPYYTSRCIDNKLYVISSGLLRKEDKDIITYYYEDNMKKEIPLNTIQYLKTIKTSNQTIISMMDLNNLSNGVKVNPYLIDINNAYVSQKNIYLLDTDYQYRYYDKPQVKDLFTLKGVYGLFQREDKVDTWLDKSNYKTNIYKFNLLEDGTIQYDTKTKVDGQTINQFSVDEFQDNLRVALTDNNGSRVVVFDKDLKQVGETSYLAKGEKMYSSRFMGTKAYLVTYRTVDPLYVIDLSSPSNPKVLGELKIPGYSTYLHPYDENHMIGIGMETKETVNRDSMGRVRSTTARIVGMKMALFDVSNVNNPVQISSTVIGDSRATSAILTNHKALLFSKEKELIAIPVNNYAEDFEVNSSENYSSLVSAYTNYSKKYVSEGYFVYSINLKDGFNLKGTITHDKKTSSYYSYYNTSRLLRGLYIDDYLFTVSEDYVKANRLDNLDLVSQLNVKTREELKKTDIAVTEPIQNTQTGVTNTTTNNNVVEILDR